MTVVVVTWNSRPHLAALIDSLPDGLEGIPRWQLVVVDNDSQDGTPDEVQHLWPSAHVVRMGRNAGYAAAINAGVDAAGQDDIVVVMNPDLRLEPGCVAALTSELSDHVGLTFPGFTSEDGSLSTSIRREPSVARVWAEALLGGRRAAALGLSETVGAAEEYAAPHDIEWATGAMLAISPACRAAVGAWDESFFLYSEEVDYCRRVREVGFRVRFVPRARAMHASGPYGSDPALWRILIRNRAIDFRRHHGRVRSVLFQAGLATGQVLRSPGSAAHRGAIGAALARSQPSKPRATRRSESTDPPGFIWFAAQDWWYHNQAHSDFQLMRHVATTRRVLVVNSLGLRLPRRGSSTNPARRILRKARSTAKFIRRPVPAVPGFHVMTPVILPLYGEGRGARLNAWLIRQQVRVAARLVGISRDPDIGVTIPTAWPVVSQMDRASLVFNRSDLQSAFPEADGEWVRTLEEQLLTHSDRVLYVSHELMRMDRDLVGDRAVFLDHGVEVEHFVPGGDLDSAVARLPRPRIGFFGGLDDYVVDMDLLRKTAAELPDVQLVLVGDATCSMDELCALPNVHWLGHRSYTDIPSLGRGFDVALMPWLDNEWIRFANPIKLKEYLALGLTVVTTDYPEVDAYRDRVRVAKTRDDFVTLIREALSEPGDPPELRASVLGDTWQARAATLTNLTHEIKESRCAE